MTTYIIRRILTAIPTVLGIVFLVFLMFFIANTPEDMARSAIGSKATQVDIEKWVKARGYDLPRFWNAEAKGFGKITETLVWRKCARVLIFDLGKSDATTRDIGSEIRRRMWPSLAIGLPTFALGLIINTSLSLVVAFLRGTYLDRGATILCVLMMSISGLFYIIGGQFVFAQWLKLFPISGFDWGNPVRFLFLPVIIGVITGIAGGVRWGRTIMGAEVGKDYVRTARAKGLGEKTIMFRHVLKNAAVPIVTGAVMALPFLFMGNMIQESFFGIPGLGGMTMQAIVAQDYAVIRSMTYIGALLYILGLIMTDISYTLVDPRITLSSRGKKGIREQPTLTDILGILGAVGAVGIVAYGIFMGARSLMALETRVPIIPNAAAGLVVLGLLGFIVYARQSVLWMNAWRQVRRSRLAMVSLVFVLAYLTVGLMDSVTWSDRQEIKDAKGNVSTTLTPPMSILDRLCTNLREGEEKTYSAPFAENLLIKETVLKTADGTPDGEPVLVDGKPVRVRVYKPLNHPRTHWLGTTQTGQDVVYVALKGVRTALIIGGLVTIIAVPFAILFGVTAGYFGGWVDDLIQYFYTTLRSVPSVLLIACFMLVFGRGIVQLCIVMGITGWVGLCRLLRGETLKLREREYVQAANALGVSKFQILLKHIVPNLMHLVLISIVLRFSGLVLNEAILSYIGIGVGPDTFSWGTMINGARNELGRDPIIWWNLAAAFIAMFGLVLPANLFADALRDALDPSLRVRGAGDRS